MKIECLGKHPEFLSELARLHFEEWRHLTPGKTLADRIRKLRAMAASDEMPFMVVAFDGRQLIGSAALVYEDMTTRKDLSPWLASVFVKPEFRRKGIAKTLVGYIEKRAAQRNIRRLFLFTEHARGLYADLGWADLQACEYQGADVVIMSRELDTSQH